MSIRPTKQERDEMRRAYNAWRRTPHSRKWCKWQLRRQRGLCFYCDLNIRLKPGQYEVDHRTPIARGGTNDESNLCIACVYCNRLKSADYLFRVNEYEKVMKSREVRGRVQNKQITIAVDRTNRELDERLAWLVRDTD